MCTPHAGLLLLLMPNLVSTTRPAQLSAPLTSNHTSPLNPRHTHASLTHPVGMEKKKLPDLNVNSCAGLKIAVQNFQVRRGIAMLRPENCCVLGGSALFLSLLPFVLLFRVSRP